MKLAKLLAMCRAMKRRVLVTPTAKTLQDILKQLLNHLLPGACLPTKTVGMQYLRIL